MNGSIRPQRILQIHNRYREHGGEDSVVDAHRAILDDAGYAVRRFEVTNPQRTAAAAINLSVAAWNPATARRLKSSLDDWRPDFAHVHNTWFSASPSTVSTLSRQGVPTVMTLHNYRMTCVNAQLLREGGPCELCVGSSPWTGVRYRCYRDSFVASAAAATAISMSRRFRVFEAVERFLVFTRFQRDLMIRAGIEDERLAIVHNFTTDPGARVSPPGDSDIVLYVGRLSPEKGIEQLVKGWAANRPGGMRLLIVGAGPLRQQLEAFDAPGVEFTGRLSPAEISKLMLSSRALAYPSICYEGQPLVLLEAMAAGLPILAPKIGGVAATLGVDALWVDNSWASAFDDMARLDSDDLARVGLAGRQRYMAKFTPERVLNQLRSVYSEMTT